MYLDKGVSSHLGRNRAPSCRPDFILPENWNLQERLEGIYSSVAHQPTCVEGNSPSGKVHKFAELVQLMRSMLILTPILRVKKKRQFA
jgi:hypothetical protein